MKRFECPYCDNQISEDNGACCGEVGHGRYVEYCDYCIYPTIAETCVSELHKTLRDIKEKMSEVLKEG